MARERLTVFAAASGVSDISAHLAWIDSELNSVREFERTGEDTAHLLDPDRLNAAPDASVQLEAVWEIFRAAVRIPRQQDRQTLQELAVTLADMGGLADILLEMPTPKAPCLTAANLQTEMAEVSAALAAQEQTRSLPEELTQTAGL